MGGEKKLQVPFLLTFVVLLVFLWVAVLVDVDLGLQLPGVAALSQ